jgi:Cdc6-like AAA superfamily ATPase
MIFLKSVKAMSDIENPNRYSPDLLDDYFFISQSIRIYYMPEREIEVQKMANEFSQMSLFETKTLKLNLICRNQQSRYYIHAIRIEKPMIYDLALNYGEKFVRIHGKIMKELNKKEGKGIVLLHGIPGTGKSTLFSY